MKKNIIIRITVIILILVMTLSLYSCEKTENDLLSTFKTMTQEEPTIQNLSQAVAFMDLNIGNISKEGASRFVLAYEDYLSRFLNENQEIDQSLVDPKLFMRSIANGDINIVLVDYGSLLQQYKDYISVELQELLIIKDKETINPSMEDSMLKLSYKDLLERALNTENLLNEHKSQDSLRANALEYYQEYLFLLLAGADNSPLFDYETGEFSPKAREAYENFIVTYPDTVITSTLTEYFSYLNNIKFTLNYMDATENEIFYSTCDYLIKGALKSFE